MTRRTPALTAAEKHGEIIRRTPAETMAYLRGLLMGWQADHAVAERDRYATRDPRRP